MTPSNISSGRKSAKQTDRTTHRRNLEVASTAKPADKRDRRMKRKKDKKKRPARSAEKQHSKNNEEDIQNTAASRTLSGPHWEQQESATDENPGNKKVKRIPIEKLDYSQHRVRPVVPFTRNKALNAFNTFEAKVYGVRTKFEEISRSVRGLQYYTYHGNDDMASIDTFLCVYDEIPTTVKDQYVTKKRDDGPKFFIQARPNFPVQKLAELFTTMGREMSEGKTSGTNWEFGTSGSELLKGLFGEKERDRLIRESITRPKSAKLPLPVYGPGYTDRVNANETKKVTVVKFRPGDETWLQKFKDWDAPPPPPVPQGPRIHTPIEQSGRTPHSHAPKQSGPLTSLKPPPPVPKGPRINTTIDQSAPNPPSHVSKRSRKRSRSLTLSNLLQEMEGKLAESKALGAKFDKKPSKRQEDGSVGTVSPPVKDVDIAHL